MKMDDLDLQKGHDEGRTEVLPSFSAYLRSADKIQKAGMEGSGGLWYSERSRVERSVELWTPKRQGPIWRCCER